MKNRHHVVELVLHVIQFVAPLWALASPVFANDRGFYTEIRDRLGELEDELLKWQEKQMNRIVIAAVSPEQLAKAVQ